MVEHLLGKREITSFGKESAFGTAVARTDILGINTRFEPTKNDNNYQEVQGAASDTVNIISYELGPRDLGGNLIFTPQNWKMLTFLLGSQNTTGSDPYTHTFSNDATTPSLTLERAIQHTTDRVRIYEGVKVNSMTLNFDSASAGSGTGGYVRITSDIVAEDINNGTSTTSIAAPSTIGFQFRHAKLTLNSTEITDLVSGNIIVNNNNDDGRVANATVDRNITEPNPQVRRFNGRFSIRPTDDTFFDFWDTGTAIGGTNTLELIRGANDKLTLTFTNLMPRSVPDPTNLEGINTTDLNWAATNIAFVAIDSIASYP